MNVVTATMRHTRLWVTECVNIIDILKHFQNITYNKFTSYANINNSLVTNLPILQNSYTWSYNKNLDIANRLRDSCAHVEGIYDNPATLKSRLIVTQGTLETRYNSNAVLGVQWPVRVIVRSVLYWNEAGSHSIAREGAPRACGPVWLASN